MTFVSTAILNQTRRDTRRCSEYRRRKPVSIRIRCLYLLRNAGVAAQFEGGLLAAIDEDEPDEPGEGGGIRGPEDEYQSVSGRLLSNRLLRKNARPRIAKNPPTPRPMRGSPVRKPSISISPKPTPSSVTPARRYRPCAREVRRSARYRMRS